MPPRPLVAVLSFPGNNCEVESVRMIRRNGMEALYFRWNDDRSKLKDADAYFIPGGFSYEDRGRSGMVAGRDPLMDFIRQEAEAGKAVIGNCNGAQILVESGLIPLCDGLRMSLARNAVREGGHYRATGFLSEWVWITPTGGRDRCATSDWEGAMHLPIAHGEGRFTTNDKDLFSELKKNNQIAFSYCDETGQVSDSVDVTPNGSTFAAAGICNPAGNVVALMPHPERTDNGDPYFASLRRWIEKGPRTTVPVKNILTPITIGTHVTGNVELFIDTIIVNNEERTVEQTARRMVPSLKLKQWKYFCIPQEAVSRALADLTIFNPNKERAFIRSGKDIKRWKADGKADEKADARLFAGTLFLRRDIPDTGADAFGKGAETGIAYGIGGISEQDISSNSGLLEVFCNPHSSVLERL